MSVSVALLRPLARELLLREARAGTILGTMGIAPHAIGDSSEMIPMRTFASCVESALATTGDPALGLAAGANVPLDALLGLGPLLCACDDLKQALDMIVRYAPVLCTEAKWALRVGTRDANVSLVTSGLHGAARGYMEDFLAISIYRLAEALLPAKELPRLTMRFAREAPASLARHRAAFACELNFDSDEGQLSIPAALLSLPNIHADAFARSVFCNYLEDLVRRRNGDSLRERARSAIRHGLVETPLCVRTIAAGLGMSPRAMRRQLQCDGTSATALIAEELMRIASAELARGGVSIKDVSHELGFSEPSSFHRAFKRWTGKTPAQFMFLTRCSLARV